MDSLLVSRILTRAAALLFVVELPAFTPQHAIFAVGGKGNEMLAVYKNNIDAINTTLFALSRSEKRIVDKKEKCKCIWDLVIELPDLKKKTLGESSYQDYHPKKLADAIRLAGFDDSYLVNGQAKYMSVHRYVKGITKKNKGMTQQQPTSVLSAPKFSIPIIKTSVSSIGPPCASIFPLSIPSISPLSSSSTATISPRSTTTTESSVKQSFSKITSIPETRKTVKAKQDEREMNCAISDARSAAYKVASILHASNESGRLKLKKFGSALKVATAVNKIFEVELISGNDVKKCVRDKRVGQSPPRQGAPTRLPREVFIHICNLVFSTNSIDQFNCDPNRLDRVAMRDQIMSMVNKYMEKKGFEPFNDIAFYRRIENELARKVKLTATDERDAIRAAWLTYENQKMHYDAWYVFLIDHGFGRPATAEEKIEHGSIVLYPGQVRVLLFL